MTKVLGYLPALMSVSRYTLGKTMLLLHSVQVKLKFRLNNQHQLSGEKKWKP